MGTIDTAAGVLGVGYQGRQIGEFVAELTAAGVEVLADVRLTPISRKPGFSKRALADALAGAGIEYWRLRELGNPKPNRAGFAGSAGELTAARARYAALLEDPDAQSALDRLADRARGGRVAVMCFEADERRCHRQVVLAEVRRRSRCARPATDTGPSRPNDRGGVGFASSALAAARVLWFLAVPVHGVMICYLLRHAAMRG